MLRQRVRIRGIRTLMSLQQLLLREILPAILAPRATQSLALHMPMQMFLQLKLQNELLIAQLATVWPIKGMHRHLMPFPANSKGISFGTISTQIFRGALRRLNNITVRLSLNGRFCLCLVVLRQFNLEIVDFEQMHQQQSFCLGFMIAIITNKGISLFGMPIPDVILQGAIWIQLSAETAHNFWIDVLFLAQ